MIRRFQVLYHAAGDPPAVVDVEAGNAVSAQLLVLTERRVDHARLVDLAVEELPPRASDRAGWPVDLSGARQ